MYNPMLPFALFSVLNANNHVSFPSFGERSPITRERVQEARRSLRWQWAKILGGVVVMGGIMVGASMGVITSGVLAMGGLLVGLLTSGYGAYERAFIGPEDKRVLKTAHRMKKKGIPLRSEKELAAAVAEEEKAKVAAPSSQGQAVVLPSETLGNVSSGPSKGTEMAASCSQNVTTPSRPPMKGHGGVETLEDDS